MRLTYLKCPEQPQAIDYSTPAEDIETIIQKCDPTWILLNMVFRMKDATLNYFSNQGGSYEYIAFMDDVDLLIRPPEIESSVPRSSLIAEQIFSAKRSTKTSAWFRKKLRKDEMGQKIEGAEDELNVCRCSMSRGCYGDACQGVLQ